jgi:two-component system nitrogen regulation response regulator GlnG
MITARIVERELSEQAPPSQSEGAVTLSALVERNLASYFAGQPGGVPPVGLYDRVLADIERPLFQLTLAATKGNQMRAAEVLGLNRNTLRKRLHDLGIEAKGRP